MHRAVWVSVALVFAACESMESSGDLLGPAREANSSFVEVEPAPAPSPEPAEEEPDATEEPADAPPTVSDDPLARLLAARDAQPDVVVHEPEAASIYSVAWAPGESLPGSWGVVLLSTDTVSHPPTAVLGLPDGGTVVVSAGDMLPEVGVVLMAVGVNAAQIATISSQGDRARVISSSIHVMHPVDD